MSAPVASGWSGRRVGLAPTGKAPPCHGARGNRSFADTRRGDWVAPISCHSIDGDRTALRNLALLPVALAERAGEAAELLDALLAVRAMDGRLWPQRWPTSGSPSSSAGTPSAWRRIGSSFGAASADFDHLSGATAADGGDDLLHRRGSDGDFSTGIEAPDRVRITWAQRLEFTSAID